MSSSRNFSIQKLRQRRTTTTPYHGKICASYTYLHSGKNQTSSWRIVAVSAHREVEKAARNKNIAKLYFLTLNETLDNHIYEGIIFKTYCSSAVTKPPANLARHMQRKQHIVDLEYTETVHTASSKMRVTCFLIAASKFPLNMRAFELLIVHCEIAANFLVEVDFFAFLFID